ncbi:MAG: DEAD/DEAH box helicase [Hyphomicrobiaceae bacterium]|nr:DEAD/DEAH box helicase [Hyphomicrobiaceae bacterium]
MSVVADTAYCRRMLIDSRAAAEGTPAAKPPSSSPSPRRGAARTRARAVLDRPPETQGWSTTDEQEIELRRWRGRTEISAVEPVEPRAPIFGIFRVRSESGSSYDVEIRSLDQHVNSCGCIDHRVNGLGTCKHVEGVLEALRRQGGREDTAARVSLRIEIFLDRRNGAMPTIVWPEGRRPSQAAHEWLEPFLKSDSTLRAEPAKLAGLLKAWTAAPAHIRRQMRVSQHLAPWLERQQRQRSQGKAREAYLREVESGKASFDDLTRLPLLPYQRDGMLHLAFGERALLADEMGLGKTVQAIAAAELLARRRKVARVLVVCPASLKAEWEEQIARFTDRPARSVFGPRQARLAAYREPSFFNIVNYEQVLSDAAEINALLAPDLVILDEAQRIKNWQTKTAREVKKLRSPFAFVLTGTPLENRIDELYSIVQYLDPELFGPLFRFNREFYVLDERGRPTDYQNLAALRDRVASVMLRRRKADVETELPGRTVTNYFVAMADEQRARYDEYAAKAAKLLAQAQRRPLRPEEFEQLQKWLACMRMICDTPAILDPECRISPKIEELERVLADLLAEPDAKVIVFSEWERMLDMVRELAREMGIEVAWHTGSVPQHRRRAEINRFKQDPQCRLFLSTDSGSVGLNLQVASAVVNVDLPWNPAKLEQRIARAWRKGQVRSVTVVNLVAEDTIEHSMVHLLGAKQALADGVLDGKGDLDTLKMPSGRAAMIERLDMLMRASVRPARVAAEEPRALSLEEAVAEELKRCHGERALLIEARQGEDGRVRLLAVLDANPVELAAEARRLAAPCDGVAHPPAVEVIDHATWALLQRLKASGLIQFAGTSPRRLHQSAALADDHAARLAALRAADLKSQAERQLRKAQVLATGGFPEEVTPLIAQSIGHAAAARLALLGELAADTTSATPAEVCDLVARQQLPARAAELIDKSSATTSPTGEGAERLLAAAAEIISTCTRRAEPLPLASRGVLPVLQV